jgi:hypothetical protein
MQTTTLTIEEISNLILEYYRSNENKHLRLGQFFCNKLNITDSDLFYCCDKNKCINMMFLRYSDNK